MDNDNNGFADFPLDLGCTGPLDLSERSIYACNDGIDNDNDKKIDYPNDLGCDTLLDDDEYNLPRSNPSKSQGKSEPDMPDQENNFASILFVGEADTNHTVFIAESTHVITAVKSNSGIFSASISSLRPGVHTFSLYSENEAGERSKIVLIPVHLSPNVTTEVGNIRFEPIVTIIPSPVGKDQEKEVPGDINKDKKINLIDFSIIAYWFKKPNPPTHVDMNKDGIIDLKDFSILAYRWTN